MELNETLLVADDDLESVTGLDEALSRLEAVSLRQALRLQHRYFGGLSLEESATAVAISLATAKLSCDQGLLPFTTPHFLTRRPQRFRGGRSELRGEAA